MNFDAPPKPSLLKVTIWIVAGLILLLLTIVFGGYYVVMHTAVPLRMMASAFSQAGEEGGNFRIDGVTGSIAKGFKIRTIKWGTEGVDASQVDDVSVAYSSFWDLMGGRVVFKDIHIGKARLDVTGIEQMADEFSDNANMYFISI